MSSGRLLLTAMVAVAVVAPACGNRTAGPGKFHAPETKPAGTSAPAVSDAGSAAAGSASKRDKTAAAVQASRTPGAQGANAANGSSAANSDTLPPNYVFGAPMPRDGDDRRPVGCDFVRGQTCRFRFNGTYGLTDADQAVILIGAYEDGSSKAAFSTTLPGARKGRRGYYVDNFPYLPGPAVKQVDIRATLIGPDGKVIASGKPNTFSITDAHA